MTPLAARNPRPSLRFEIVVIPMCDLGVSKVFGGNFGVSLVCQTSPQSFWLSPQTSQNLHGLSRKFPGLVGKRFAHQRFADSSESIRKTVPIFEALGQIRANRVFLPIRIQIRVIRVQSSLLSIQ